MSTSPRRTSRPHSGVTLSDGLRSAGLTLGERVRLALMAMGTIFLLLMMLLLLTGKLDTLLGAMAGGDKDPQTANARRDAGDPAPDQGAVPLTGDGAGEETADPFAGQRPSSGGLPTPRTVPDPGDDDSWRTSANYLRYREYMAQLLTKSDEELAAEVDPDVRVFSHVWRAPEKYKGQVIRLRGVLVRRKAKEDIPEDLPDGAEVKWEVQVYNYGSKHIYTLDLIGDCPESLLYKPVSIDAIFFDVYEYMASKNVLRRSCFFIGRNMKSFVLRQPSPWYLFSVLGVPIILVLSFAFFEARKLAKFEREHLWSRSRRQYEANKRFLAEGGKVEAPRKRPRRSGGSPADPS